MWAGESCELKSNGVSWNKVGGRTIPMVAGIHMLANQTFSNSTFTPVAFDTSLVLKAPAAMQDLPNHRISIQRAGVYNYDGRILWASNSSGTMCYIQLGIGGTATGLCPRDQMFMTSSTNITTKMSGIYSASVGDLLTAMGYYQTGSPSPTITGDTAISAIGNSFTITEIPTW